MVEPLSQEDLEQQHEDDRDDNLLVLRDLAESEGWRLVIEDYNTYLRDARNQLERVFDPDERNRLQGDCRTVRFLMKAPERLIKAEKKSAKKK